MLLLAGFVLAGLILGVVVVSDAMLDHFRISRQFLDGNVMNVASPNRTIFPFLLVRFFDIIFALMLVFLFNMSKFSMWLTFPYLGFRAFWSVVNLFWIIDRYGFVHGGVFFIFYLVIFIAVLLLLLVSTVFMIKKCAQIRKFGFRGCCRWHDIKRPIAWICTGVFAIGFVEWLLYFLVLGRLVFII